jgi:hypothetical protein
MAMGKRLLVGDDEVGAAIASGPEKGKVEPLAKEKAPRPEPERLPFTRTPLRLPTIAIASVTVVERELDALLEALDAGIKVAGLALVETAACPLVQTALDPARFVAKAVRAALADAVAAVEPLDLALERVDPDLERADHAPIALAVTVVGVVAIGIRRRLRLRIVLRSSGAGDDKSRACGGQGKNDLTHYGSP